MTFLKVAPKTKLYFPCTDQKPFCQFLEKRKKSKKFNFEFFCDCYLMFKEGLCKFKEKY